MQAKAIWYDESGQGRNLYARFRLTLDLKSKPENAILHLFADTTYQLYINGKYVRLGSLRFDPRHPVYDSHDLSGLLQEGRNVIAVQVNYVGHKTFITMLSQAGLTAWGEVTLAGGERIELATGSAVWKASAAPAYRYAAKSSLFLKAGDLYDQRLEETGDWSGLEFDDSSWISGGVELANQQAWGEPEARGIPYMSGEPVPVERVLHLMPLEPQELLCSFSVPMPHVNEIHEPELTSRFMAVKTWIYSPEDVVITMGLFYQNSWINGEPIAKGLYADDKSMRLNHRVSLRRGWNAYFAKCDSLQDMYHHYLALPEGFGLVVSADRDPEGTVLFHRSPVVSHELYASAIKGRELPFATEDELEDAGGWIEVTVHEQGESPTMSTGWDTYGHAFESIEPDQLTDRVFSTADYPNGFSLLIDLGLTRLVLPRVVLEGAGGATVDLTYGEHLNADGKHLRHYHWYGLGDRAYGDKRSAQLDWRLTQPRGFRYVQLTVRNPKQDVVLRGLELASASYPVETKGTFRCSDPLLEQIWEMGVRTEAVNMEDAYTDCVTRERGQYIRDTIIQYHNNLAVFGDQALMRRSLQLMGQSPDATGKFRAVYPNTGDYTISDFALNALEGFWAYYEQTGDAQLVETYWDAIQHNLAWFHELADEREDLLLDAEWDVKRGINAHYGGFHGDLAIVKGYLDITGIHCVFSCTYLIALRAAAKLAGAIGKREEISELERRIATLEQSIRDTFWDEERGCYSDNEQKLSHSAHASLFAARAGVLTAEQLEPVRAHVRSDLKSLFVNGYGPEDGVYVSPSFSFYIFEGLYLIGLTDTAERMMRQGWGWFLQKGLKQTPEYYDLGQSLCHAWSACPTYFMSTHVLGVHLPTIEKPDEVVIHVQTAEVTEAEGAVPHALGLIEVKWHTDKNGARVFDYVRVPDGLRATIVQ
ncbi:alpha-L-rhamnosidase N-terminal domain-containing protein [Paenibacillus sp. BC26]|uniref:alpha-L-rhamnosidase-related protein n=1 Tax=Paenibacillus sp. BC26 TaxID=1881032 RepID=UPI0008E78965|nr:alpha-L-rhamnosidase N-terminal domain-containing protein [Paenibacillus sp. BC26]SFT14629.1 Alpha-L-rhamnosidase N-terminal domain-containing protein [Paenibacillus sp. BC26]